MTKFTKKQNRMLKALQQYKGIVTDAAKKAGIERKSHYRWLEDNPDYAQEVNDIQETVIDFVESSLYQQITKKNTTATMFYLRTRGKNRGYQETNLQEIDVKNPVSIEFTNIDNYPEIGGEKSAKENKGKNIQDKK